MRQLAGRPAALPCREPDRPMGSVVWPASSVSPRIRASGTRRHATAPLTLPSPACPVYQVNMFMHRAERALHSKVSVEDMQGVKDQLLDSFRNSHSQLSDKTARLKGRVDVAETELARAHEALQAKGSQSSVDALSALADHLRLSVDEINAQLETKAAAGEVLPRLSSLEATMLEHASGMASKVDAATISNRHVLHVADMAMHLDRLTGRSDEVHNGLVAVHAAVEEFAAPERQAAQQDIAAESGREALKKVATLQDELGGRVTIIEEWMEQHPSSKSRRAQMKLQRRPGAKEEEGSPHTAEPLGDAPYKEPAEALQLDSIEPSHGASLHGAAAEMARLNNTVATQQASLEFLREEVHVLRSMLAAALDNGHVLGAASQVVGHGAPSQAMGAPDGGAVAGAIGPLAAAAGGVPGGGLGQSHALDGDTQHSTTPCGPTPSAPAKPWSTGRILPSQQPQAWATPQPTARARQPSPPRQQQTLAEPPRVPISGPTYVPGPMLPAQQEHSAIVQSALRAAQAAAAAASAGKPAGSSGSLGVGTGGSPPSTRGHQTASPRDVHPSPGCGRAEECPTGPVPTWMGAPSVGLHGALPTDTGTTELIRIDMSGSVALPIGANDGQRFPELAARTPVPHVPRGADPYYEQHRPPQMRARHAGGDMRPGPPPSSATGSPRSQAAARSSSPGRPHQVFKNEPEKRAWMLKEKRKAVIEDRLGPQPWGDGDAGHYDVAHDVLPPISSSAGFSDEVRLKGGPL